MIVQALVDSFLFEILTGVHTPQDVYRIALYVADADLSERTTAYTTKNEVQGQGYGAGGLTLAGYKAVQDTLSIEWANPVWPITTITARGALIYNFTKQNRAVAVLDLGKNFISTNGEFKITLPPTLVSLEGVL